MRGALSLGLFPAATLPLAACLLGSVSAAGHPCPCLSGWTCDTTANVCVPLDGAAADVVTPDAHTRDAQGGGDAGSDAAGMKDTSGADVPDGGGKLIFDEEFNESSLDTTTKWAVTGGVWDISGGQGHQTDGNSTTAVMYAQGFGNLSDYHIVARMRSTGPFGIGQDLAPELAFRIDPGVNVQGVPELYDCDFDLLQDQLMILGQLPSGPGPVAMVPVPVPGSFDPGTPFVLDVVVKGTSVTCKLTVDGLGQIATVSTTMLTVPRGTFGLKTYTTSAAYDYFRVYALP